MTVELGNKFTDDERIVWLDWRTAAPGWARHAIVVAGNFDGVHRGHAALIRRARDLARSVGSGGVTVITLDPHPLKLLAPERYQLPLSTPEERARQIRRAGADAVVILRIDLELLQLTAETFFQQILIEGLAARGITEGFNFRFGRDRKGSVDTLRDLCQKAGIAFAVCDAFALDGQTVSSSHVRDALAAGDVVEAARLLGRSYRVEGDVVVGARRGRTIGFPTANLGNVLTFLPADGVYAVIAHQEDRYWAAAANVGPNPTFGENERKLEVHLIDFTGDLYDRRLQIEFVNRLRDTRKFAGVDELIQQMKHDVDRARHLLGGALGNR